MTLIADFNLEDEKGRIPVLLDEGTSLNVGDVVVVADREGNRCKAWVAEISYSHEGGTERLVAFVTPKPGTWEKVESSSHES